MIVLLLLLFCCFFYCLIENSLFPVVSAEVRPVFQKETIGFVEQVSSQARCPSCHLTNSVKALKHWLLTRRIVKCLGDYLHVTWKQWSAATLQSGDISLQNLFISFLAMRRRPRHWTRSQVIGYGDDWLRDVITSQTRHVLLLVVHGSAKKLNLPGHCGSNNMPLYCCL